jgi:hypothetical protein
MFDDVGNLLEIGSKLIQVGLASRGNPLLVVLFGMAVVFG